MSIFVGSTNVQELKEVTLNDGWYVHNLPEIIKYDLLILFYESISYYSAYKHTAMDLYGKIKYYILNKYLSIINLIFTRYINSSL